jgi:transposase-like protein
MEVLRGEKSVGQICRVRDITEALYYKWRDAFFERAPSVFEDQRSGSTEPASERVAELERMLGQLTMENAILKKASSRLEPARRKNGT